MKIEILGAHNAEVEDCNYVSILIDDLIAIDAGCLTSTLTAARQKELKAILLSHIHYDHVRDIPAIALNKYTDNSRVKVYATQVTCRGITKYLLNGIIYPKFHSIPIPAPVIELSSISPGVHYNIFDYGVTALSVTHVAGAVAYSLVDSKGKSIFYTGDTGPGFNHHLKDKFPSIIISEVTFPNKAEQHAILTNHLTPKLLRLELERVFQNNGSIPPVLAIHMEPQSEVEIRAELMEVSRALNTKIDVAKEGLIIHL
jgi:ribonuclease BN (tRNA processing enzyme)